MADLVEMENLENLLSPFCYGPETPLPKTSPGDPPILDNFHFRQFLSKDCQFGCVYNKSLMKCFAVDSRLGDGNVRGQVPLSISTDTFQFPADMFISCVTELKIHNQRTTSALSKLLLGLNVHNESGALVLFDPIRAQPMKFITLPAPATSLTVLSHFEEGGSNRPFFNEAMMAMVGIAAVGMQGGQVLIIDLGLDNPNLSAFHHSSAYVSISGNVLSKNPFHPLMVDPHEYIIATKRHHAVAKNELIVLSVLNEAEDEEMDTNDFHYCKPNGEMMMTFPKQGVTVTCVEYIPAIGSLVIGFGFGCFQIWRVDNISLIFSSNLTTTEAGHHIFGFSFIQPVDDPKNYCYLWVLFGRRGKELSHSHVELHCLNFGEKPYVENFGYTYDELRQCVRRLSFQLEDYFEEKKQEERLDPLEERRYYVRPLRIWSQPENNNLTFFAWESRRNGTYYIGIFDLNQWYSNHTLEFIRYNPMTGLCPYWVAIPIEALDPYSDVWDVRIVPGTLEKWENPHMKLDIHLYPASVSFQAVSITSSGVGCFQHFGVQEKLIRKLLSDGTHLMLQPENIRRTFKTYGLQPVFPLRFDANMTAEDADRYYIFSVLMETRRTPIIIQFAAIWLDGSYTNVGCTVDLILDWIASYTTAIRVMATEHWENFFGFKNEVLSPETSHFINYSNFLWNSLHEILTTIMRPDEVYSVRSAFIEDLEFGLNKLVQYSAALLMMYKAEILPEKDELDVISTLLIKHEDRRQEVKDALEQCPFIEPSLKNIRPMMIDYLLEAFDENLVREQWNVAPGDNLYPPRHIGYILNMFMWLHENPKDIARVIAYFLLDISDIATVGDKAKLRGDFLSVMKLSSEEQAEVFNLWLLDHGSVHEPLVFLSQRDRIDDSDELPWSASTVVCTALGYDEDVLDVLQKSCPQRLRNLYMNLMTKDASQYKSLCDYICSSPSINDEAMLYNFFKVSLDRNCLSEFIKTKLRYAPSSVVEALVEFLLENRNFENDDRLLSIYIQLDDYKRLGEQYQKMKKLYEGKLKDDERQRWMIREGLVNHLMGTRKTNIVLQFLKSSSPRVVVKSRPTLKIKAAKVDSPTENIADQSIKLPPQLRKLKLLQSKPSDPLSPLRRYAGRLHAVISTCNSSSPSSLEKSKRESLASMSIFRRSEAQNATLSPIPDESMEQFCDGISICEDETLHTINKNKSPVNLQRLLKIPLVDHRVSRRSISFLAVTPSRNVGESIQDSANQSVYFTPHLHKDIEMEIHSIMKKEDSVSRRREKIRFLDLSKESIENDMETSGENLSQVIVQEGEENETKIFIESQYNGLKPIEEGFPSESSTSSFVLLNSTTSIFDTSIVTAPLIKERSKSPTLLKTKSLENINIQLNAGILQDSATILDVPEQSISIQPHLNEDGSNQLISEEMSAQESVTRSQKRKLETSVEEGTPSDSSLISESTISRPRKRSTRSKTPTLKSLAPQQNCKEFAAPSPVKVNAENSSQMILKEVSTPKKNTRRSNKRLNTSEGEEEHILEFDASSSFDSVGKPTRRSSRSMTPTLRTQPLLPFNEDKEEDVSTPKEKTRSRKQKLSTSVDELTSESDTSLVSEPPLRKRRSSRSMTPTLFTPPQLDDTGLHNFKPSPSKSTGESSDQHLSDEGSAAKRMTRSQKRRLNNSEEGHTPESEISSIFDTSVEPAPRTRKRSTRSKTPTLVILPPLEEDKVLDIVEPCSSHASVSGVTTRSRATSKTPSPTKSDKSDIKTEQTEKLSSKRRRVRQNRIFDYSPDLSTVLEDSTTEVAILEQSTIPPVGGVSPVPKGRTSRKKLSKVEEYEPEAKARKRSRKSVVPEQLDETALDDDDAKSDISIRSTRSTRSNRSNGSTASKKSNRSRRTKSAQE